MGESAKAHFPNKHVSEHRAVPNKAPSKEPIFPMPFPVTKSFLPLSVLPPEDCHSEDGLVGECLSAVECGATSGQPSGLCHMGRDVSLHARDVVPTQLTVVTRQTTGLPTSNHQDILA